jgi:geranylgeranyl diphosphate synthase type I
MTTLRRRPAPPDLLLIAERVDRRLTELLREETDRWTALDPDLADLLGPLERLVMAGGKRLRPAFCHWGHVGAGGSPDDAQAVDAGAALEMLQAFALLHDDVMDDSDTRRGTVTAHVAAADRHELARWRGESRRFGDGVAVLAGDLAHVYADRLMARAPGSARLVWDELRIELNVGQYLDVVATAQSSVDRERARTIARYKSGKYTIERPLHLGAALAGRFDELAAPLSAYGDPIGEAFQLRDDLLGAFGDTELTGKPVGDDLREGKPTPLLAAAVEKANPAEAQVLAMVGQRDLDASAVEAIQEVLVATGAVAEVETAVEALLDEALTALVDVPLAGDATRALVDLAEYVAWRER